MPVTVLWCPVHGVVTLATAEHASCFYCQIAVTDHRLTTRAPRLPRPPVPARKRSAPHATL